MDASSRLAGLVELWWAAAQEFVALLETLNPEEWSSPTDLAGWDVHAVASHIAHVESMLAGLPQQQVDFEVPPHVRGAFGQFMESGVVARRQASPADLIAEIRESTTSRHASLQAGPAPDPHTIPDILPPGITWDFETLLNNRIVDVWMHQQDVRRAVGRHGNLDSASAAHTLQRLAASLGFVVGKKVGAAPGTSVTFDLGGQPVGILVDEGGRGTFVKPAAQPDVFILMTAEEFILAAGGRRSVDVPVRGDHQLSARILAQMAVTP